MRNLHSRPSSTRSKAVLRAAAAALAASWLAACAASPPPAAAPTAGGDRPALVQVSPHETWADAVLYFVVLDRFADGDPRNNARVDRSAKGAFHGGDLAGLIAQLDGIAELGATALWITPVVDNIDGFVTGAGFPDWGYHGYWAEDFNAIDPRFGTEAELARLVEEAHARGIEVLLDVVYNHPGYDSRYVTDPRFQGWTRNEGAGTCGADDLTSCVSGLPDFKTERADVAEHLLEAQLAHAERAKLDGFRLDTVKHVDHPFWQEHRKRTRARLGEEFFLVGEVWGGDAQSLDPWFAGDEMDAGFDFSFQGNVVSFLLGRGRTVAFERYLESRHKVRQGYHLAHFLSSHDVPGSLSLLGGDVGLFRLAALLQMTTSGIPTVYYGEEVARPGGDWPDNRSDMPWGDSAIQPGAGLPRDEALREDYRRLIAIRRAHPSLSRGTHSGVATEGDLLVFLRRDEAGGDAVAVAVNRGTAEATARFGAPAEWTGAPVRDVWSGEPVTIEGGEVVLAVPAKGARIVTVPRGAAEGVTEGVTNG